MRSALVDYFREAGQIMIATEAGAEGINLQFCSLVVNYDLPWNPQRIEQRIGRCHRYGQQHDVVVVNFVNRENEADLRVFELLSVKFRLFEGVFGASDEVLGVIESGVDFEKRIAEIYQRRRSPQEIKTSFDQLQLELSSQINDAMTRTRRQLLENFDQEVHDKLRVSMEHGKEYLLALKALEQKFTSKVRCIYLDPPYNTGSAFDYYDDGVEHSIRLTMMRDRLELLWRLLRNDGSIWITIDDNEGHYLKVMCDEIFGRKSFVGTIIWENFYDRSNAAALSPSHNYIFVYSPMGLEWKKVRRLLPRNEKSKSKYTNTDNDPRGHWRLEPIFASGERHEGLMYTVQTPGGEVFLLHVEALANDGA